MNGVIITRYSLTMPFPNLVPIAIIGAGPAGLTLARLLELANIPYTVLEKDQSATWANDHQSSGTLDIQAGRGQAALREAGLLEKFQSMARYGTVNIVADQQGNVLAELSGEGDHDKPEMDRKDLRNLLLDSIPQERIRWDHKVSDVYKENDGSVSIAFQDGSVEKGFRLVVGADGAWSKVRKLYQKITTNVPHYTGTHFFSSYITSKDPLYLNAVSKAGKGNYLAFGKEQQIFLHYLGDGSFHISIGLKFAEDSPPGEAALSQPSTLWESLLSEDFAGWTRELTDLFRSGDRKYRSWPFYTMTKDALSWDHVEGVTLVGDAAHLTVPSGDGVNLAMYDALELARLIIQHGVDDLDSAVIQYEEAMKPRSLAAVQKGEWFLEHLFNADGPGAFLQAIGIESTEV